MELKSIDQPYQGLLGLDRLPKALKALNMVMCFILATFAAVLNYSHTWHTIVQAPLHWVAWISPTCLAVAWLRLMGVKWRQALLLFLFVPIATLAILFIFFWLAVVFSGN